MKPILILLITVFYAGNSFAQDTVEVKNRLTDSVIERFFVLKSDKKTRQGPYRALFRRRVLIAAGNYKNDKKAGIWRFYETDGHLVERYNYDTQTLLAEASLDRNREIGFAFDAKITKTDTVTRPIKIGGSYYGFIPYLNIFRTPFDTFQILTQDFEASVELLITPLGRLADYKVRLTSAYYKYNRVFNLDVKLFDEADRIFVPATLNHDPVMCRILIKCVLTDVGTLDFY